MEFSAFKTAVARQFERMKQHALFRTGVERDAESLRQKNAEQRQKIMAIIDHKEGEALSAKSVEELRVELQKL